MLTQTAPSSVLRQRIYLIIIITLFVVPLALAWFLVGRWQPQHTTNHGELLNPAQPVSHFSATRPDGEALTVDFLNAHWTLLYIGDADCDQRCRTGLYDIRQVRLALGKDMMRAQTLWLMPAEPGGDTLQWLSREHIELTVGVADAQTLDFFARQFADAAAAGGWIYLIDPLGNLFMRYSTDSDPKGILDDLRHLFKISKIG
jgi:cytochrome oxidase Cu insertion factor (SCO1/SenC/PrrC family)